MCLIKHISNPSRNIFGVEQWGKMTKKKKLKMLLEGGETKININERVKWMSTKSKIKTNHNQRHFHPIYSFPAHHFDFYIFFLMVRMVRFACNRRWYSIKYIFKIVYIFDDRIFFSKPGSSCSCRRLTNLPVPLSLSMKHACRHYHQSIHIHKK